MSSLYSSHSTDGDHCFVTTVMLVLCILQKLCISTIRLEWFACVSQRSLSPACAQCYIAKISQLSHKLLDVVVNLQDDKVRKYVYVNLRTYV